MEGFKRGFASSGQPFRELMGRVRIGWDFRVQFIKWHWVLYVMAGLLGILYSMESFSSEERPLLCWFRHTAFVTLDVAAAFELIEPLLQAQFNSGSLPDDFR